MAHFTDDFLLNMVIIHRSIAMSVDWRLHDSPTHDFPHHFLTFSAKLQSAKTAKCKKCYVREVGGHHFWLFWLGLRSPTGPRCLWWPVEAPGIARASEAAGGLDARIRSSSSWGFQEMMMFFHMGHAWPGNPFEKWRSWNWICWIFQCHVWLEGKWL